MSRNDDRLNIQDNIAQPDTSQNLQQNQTPLSFPSPTEFVDIPSQGKFYPLEHPLHEKSSIEIKFMTAKEEDILNNKSLLQKGVAIDKLLQSIIVDKNIQVGSLYVGDKNALIIAARISAYTANYETKLNCAVCNKNINCSFNLDEMRVFNGDENINPDGTISLELPKSKYNVVCKLLTGYDEKYLSQSTEIKKKNKLLDTPVTDQMKLIVVSIDGNNDKGFINKCIDNLPAFDGRFLRSTYQKMIPNIDLTQNVTCSECGNEQEVMMPLMAEFFWPR